MGIEAVQSLAEVGGRHHLNKLSIVELSLGIIALIVWFGLFTGGILISTEAHRNKIGDVSQGAALAIINWLAVCAFWTITNVGILSCIAAYLGALGRRTRFTMRIDQIQEDKDGSRRQISGVGTFYVSALMRGFGVYALILAGLLVWGTETLISPSQAAYMRIAPTISIIGFYAGYDPCMFAGLLERVKSFVQTNEIEDGDSAK